MKKTLTTAFEFSVEIKTLYSFFWFPYNKWCDENCKIGTWRVTGGRLTGTKEIYSFLYSEDLLAFKLKFGL